MPGNGRMARAMRRGDAVGKGRIGRSIEGKECALSVAGKMVYATREGCSRTGLASRQDAQ